MIKKKKSLNKLVLEGYFLRIQEWAYVKSSPGDVNTLLGLESRKSQSLHQTHFNNEDFTKF